MFIYQRHYGLRCSIEVKVKGKAITAHYTLLRNLLFLIFQFPAKFIHIILTNLSKPNACIIDKLIVFFNTKQVETISSNENEQLSKTHPSTYDAVEVAVPLYPALQAGNSSGANWLSQTQQRQQALTGLQSLCNHYCVKEHITTFSYDKFCQFFSQEVQYPKQQRI